MRSKMRGAVGLSLLGMLLTGCISTELQASDPESEGSAPMISETEDWEKEVAARRELEQIIRDLSYDWSELQKLEQEDIFTERITKQRKVDQRNWTSYDKEMVLLGSYELMEGSFTKLPDEKSPFSAVWEGSIQFTNGSLEGEIEIRLRLSSGYTLARFDAIPVLDPDIEELKKEVLAEADAAGRELALAWAQSSSAEAADHLFIPEAEWAEPEDRYVGLWPEERYGEAEGIEGDQVIEETMRIGDCRRIDWEGGMVCGVDAVMVYAQLSRSSSGGWKLVSIRSKQHF